MTYIRVAWKHVLDDEPVLLYSELDAERWEVRKVEVFRDGRCGFASAANSFGGTRLGEEPIPPLTDISADPQFEPTEITREDFERVWAEYTRLSSN